MNKSHRWLALVLAAGVLASALAPGTALASRQGRPLDQLGGADDPGTMQYGDPEPGSGGSPQRIELSILKTGIWVALEVMHLRIPFSDWLLGATNPAKASSTSGARRVER